MSFAFWKANNIPSQKWGEMTLPHALKEVEPLVGRLRLMNLSDIYFHGYWTYWHIFQFIKKIHLTFLTKAGLNHLCFM